MTASDSVHGAHRRADSIAALCLLLAERDGPAHTDPDVMAAVERTRELLASASASASAPAPSPAQLDAALDALNEALRRAGYAAGLNGHARVGAIPGRTHPDIPGVRPMIKVAVCPGEVPCTRREPAKDLWPAPPCALNGVRMRRERLRP